MADPAEADTSSGTVVGILSDDLNSGMFVSLPKLPAAVEIEAAKCLLALKSEVNVARLPHESMSSPIAKYPPAQSKTDESVTDAAPSKHPSDKETL